MISIFSCFLYTIPIECLNLDGTEVGIGKDSYKCGYLYILSKVPTPNLKIGKKFMAKREIQILSSYCLKMIITIQFFLHFVEPESIVDNVSNHFARGSRGNIGMRVTRGDVGLRVTRGDVGLRVTRGVPDDFGRERRATGLGLRVTRGDAGNFGGETRLGPLGDRVTREATIRERRSGLGLRVTRSENAAPSAVDYFGRI